MWNVGILEYEILDYWNIEAARSSQKQPGAARTTREAARSNQGQPGTARSSQEQPGEAKSIQEGGIWEQLEAPGGHLGDIWGPSGGIWGDIWGHLGGIWATSGRHLDEHDFWKKVKTPTCQKCVTVINFKHSG